jgi:anti-sigma B factor antagonist
MSPESWNSVPPDIDVTLWGEGIAVVTCTGKVDVYGSNPLRAALVELNGRGLRRFLVDVSDVTYIDSTAFGTLIGALKRAVTADGSLDLVCNRENILQTLKESGLIRIFRVFGSKESARRHL